MLFLPESQDNIFLTRFCSLTCRPLFKKITRHSTSLKLHHISIGTSCRLLFKKINLIRNEVHRRFLLLTLSILFTAHYISYKLWVLLNPLDIIVLVEQRRILMTALSQLIHLFVHWLSPIFCYSAPTLELVMRSTIQSWAQNWRHNQKYPCVTTDTFLLRTILRFLTQVCSKQISSDQNFFAFF